MKKRKEWLNKRWGKWKEISRERMKKEKMNVWGKAGERENEWEKDGEEKGMIE